MLDHMVLLSGKGALVYSGPTANLVPHFEALGMTTPAHHTLLDAVLETLGSSASCAAELVQGFKDSSAGKLELEQLGTTQGAGSNPGGCTRTPLHPTYTAGVSCAAP